MVKERGKTRKKGKMKEKRYFLCKYVLYMGRQAVSYLPLSMYVRVLYT